MSLRDLLGLKGDKGDKKGKKKNATPAPLQKAEITYDDAKNLASHNDPAVRRELAARSDLKPEILYYLAEDPDSSVRQIIAGNETTPVQASLLLSDDANDDVRICLAEKIHRLRPDLSNHDQEKANELAKQVLERLARDQIPRVRKVLSEALKDVADAPPEVILRLARDVELAVSLPVLEFSPVLTDEDLLEIIADTPASARLSAISRRSRVGGKVADAIAATDDVEAITHLLANNSAQIREETLDSLIERAENRPQWHGPLVRRPKLHSRAAARLALFVADNLLLALAARRDLDENTVAAVSDVVHRRLGADAMSRHNLVDLPDDDSSPEVVDFEMDTWRRSLLNAYETARVLAKKPDGLTHKKVLNRLSRGETEFVIGAIAVMAELAPDMIGTVVEENSAKGMVAVAWKAGFGVNAITPLQLQLAKVTPEQILKPSEDGEFPLTEAEMEWQIEMFNDVAASKRPRLLSDALDRHGL